MGKAGGDPGQNRIDARLIKALEESGVSPEEISRVKARAEPEKRSNVIVVEPENAGAVRVFRQMQTQWRVQPITTARRVVLARTGLDYGALAPIAAALRVDLTEDIMDALRLLEAETLAIHMRRQEQILMQR